MDLGGSLGLCADCTSDYDCPESKKCCRFSIRSCVTYCTFPVFKTVGTSSPLIRRTSSLDDIGGNNTVSTRRTVEAKTVRKQGLQSGMSGGINVDGIIGRTRVLTTTRGQSVFGKISGKKFVKPGMGSRLGLSSETTGVVDGINDEGSQRIIKNGDRGGESGFGTKKKLGGKTIFHEKNSQRKED